MDGNTLRSALSTFLPREVIRELIEVFGVEQRSRKRDLQALVRSLVLVSGSDDSGRQADVYSAYLAESAKEVVRSSFYSWFTEELALLMTALVRRALEKVRGAQPLLVGGLKGVHDWLVVDSETVALSPALEEIFPATSTPAALKVHKTYSLGRNNVVDFVITPARDHDAPLLQIDESWRGYGLIVDLGYASLDLIRRCAVHGVELVLRLKNGWKPRLLRSVLECGELVDIDGEPVADDLNEMKVAEFDGSHLDYDVVVGRRNPVNARLVGVAGSESYHWFITTLSRTTHTPRHVGQLYRTRWEIEVDNRRDKGMARLDQIQATTVSSTLTLLHAALLRTLIANHLTHQDLLMRGRKRPPLHANAVSLALCSNWQLLIIAMQIDAPERWSRLAAQIRSRGQDPNWRRRPSQLDRLRGTTAPPGRPRAKKLKDCPPSAEAYRRRAA